MYRDGDKMSKKKDIMLNLFMKWAFVAYLFSQVFFDHTLISQFALIIISVMSFLLCLIKKKFYFNLYFIFTLLFLLQSYISSRNGISVEVQTSMKMTVTITLNFIIAVAIYNYILICDNLEESLYIFAKIVLLFSIFIIFLSFGDIFSTRLGDAINLNIFGNDITYNSNSISILAGICYLIYLYKYSKNKNKLIIPCLIWLIFIILISGSRKGFLLLFLGTPLLIYLLNPKKQIKNILTIVFILIISYLVLMKVPVMYNIAGNRIEAYVNMIFGSGVKEASADTRNLLIERGWAYFLQKPWTGYGLDCFRQLEGSYGLYSHNNYIELLVSGGIPTFICYYAIRIVVLIKLFINRESDNINKLFFVILLLLIILEYGFVAYSERLFIILFVFVLCGYKKTEGRRRKNAYEK